MGGVNDETQMHSIRVHPNSMAARKWKRTTWTTSRLYAEAASAKRRGELERAQGLRQAAARAARTTLHCG
jgi:hypothetical protein